MEETFGSTCHGAGRALSRAKSRRNIGFQDVLDKLSNQVRNVTSFPGLPSKCLDYLELFHFSHFLRSDILYKPVC